MTIRRDEFPSDFVWGTATAAYQIEGAAQEDGRGPSIWDTFSHTPGKVKNGHTGDTACDHYHRYREDIALMKELGTNAYRFSIAWPRILPEGRGRINPRGLDFYDRLIDALLEAEITPWATLYHWDLPQALEDAGGWPKRDTAYALAEYATVVGERLGDRLKHWITLNEPWCSAFLGYGNGVHAPGRQDYALSLQAAHHLLLSHGLATLALRAAVPGAKVGITLNLTPTHPATPEPRDLEAARRYDGFFNRWYLDPLFGFGYPPDMWELYGPLAPQLELDDLAHIATPLDFLGINYYSRSVVKHAEQGPLFIEHLRPEGEYTYMNWEVYPDGLREIVVRVAREYRPPSIYITENGACYPDAVEDDGEIHDSRRLAYYRSHIGKCLQAIREGAPLKGYFAWSLLDNFEWAEGYDKRFGLVYVDFSTQERRFKQSGRWLKAFLEGSAEAG